MSTSPPSSGGEDRTAEANDVDEIAWDESSDVFAAHSESGAAEKADGQRQTERVGNAQLVCWIDAIVDRNADALSSLYHATSLRVFKLAHWIVRHEALADEVVEEVYFQVWRQAARFDPTRGPAIGWLLTMARSRALDALRSESRFRCAAASGGDPSSEDVELLSDFDELLDVARDHAALHRGLLILRAQPRQLLLLAFFRGLSHEEIAAQMSLPLGTVKSQIRRALLTLRDVLSESDTSGYSA
jgi:RNA polymerase sigma factor (sigma-70 family)